MALTPSGGSRASAGQTTSKAVDVVAVLRGDTSAQVFAAARPLRATVYERARLMEHPLEDGATIADHKVQDPVEIDLPLMVPGGEALKETFEEIRQLYHEGVILTVQTRAASYLSMVLLEIPHEESAETMDAVTIGVRFREAKFVKAVYGGLAPAQVKSKPQASTAKRGAQQTTAATAPQAAKAGSEMKGSTLYRLTHKGK